MYAWCRALVLGLVGIMLACGPGQAPPASNPPPSQPAAASAAAKPAGAPATGAAWETEWAAVVAAARQEGRVTVSGPPGDLIRRNLVDGFRKAYPGIDLEFTGGPAPELVAKLEAERRGGLYTVDVLIAGTSVQLTMMKPLGAMDPMRRALILPEVTDPANWLDGRLEFADNDDTYDFVFITMPTEVVAYDPRQVRPEDVDELPKLLDPKWRGKIVISDPVVGGAGQALFRWLWAVLGPEKASEYIRALRAQAGAVDRDRRRMLEWIARGRYPIMFNPDSTTLPQLRQEGLNIGTLPEFKDYGTYVTPGFGSVSLVNEAPHPNAAKVFLNWLLTKDGQTAYSTALRQASRRLDVPRDHLSPDQVMRPGGKYWASYKEAEAVAPPELEALLREVFGR